MTTAAPERRPGAGLQAYTRQFKTGEYVFREGDLGTEMFIIQEGKIEIMKSVGKRDKLLAVLEKGDFFGEVSILEDLPRTASARAQSDATVVEINGSTFDHMLRSNPEIAVRMMRKMSRRLREADRLLQLTPTSSGQSGSIPEMPPSKVPPPGTAPQRLVHSRSGMEFRLAKEPETAIGRRDPVTGIQPEIDLSPVDLQRSVSRRHAKIYRQDGKFFLIEEIGTVNGTFVNGSRVETGVPVEIKPGEEVRFGLVDLFFETK